MTLNDTYFTKDLKSTGHQWTSSEPQERTPSRLSQSPKNTGWPLKRLGPWSVAHARPEATWRPAPPAALVAPREAPPRRVARPPATPEANCTSAGRGRRSKAGGAWVLRGFLGSFGWF